MRDFRILTAGVLLSMSAFGAAHAQDVSATVTYDPAGLNAGTYLENLNAASVTSIGDESVFVTSDDFVRTDDPEAAPHASYMSLTANSSVSGHMNSSIGMNLGGIGVASSVWHTSFVNGLQPMSYAMSVDITKGEVSLGGWTGDVNTRNMQGGFIADISVNGQSVWGATQTLSLNGSGYSLSETGAAIGHDDVIYTEANESENASQTASYLITGFTGAINLGSFAAGQTVDVTYTLSSIARWEDPDGCAYECGYVHVSIDDPLEVSGSAGLRITTAVPEPESYALMLAGLLFVGRFARRNTVKA